MAINIDAEKCIGCGICAKECPFSAVTMTAGAGGKKLPDIGAGCTECGRCVEACPKAAITRTGTSMKNVDISLYHGVWVYLADEIGTELCAVLVGSECDDLVDELFAYGAEKVYYANNPELKNYTTDGYTAAVYRAVLKYKPEIVLYGATHIGRDLAPSVAVKCGTGLTADCTKLDIDPETKGLRQTRPAFGGNLMATIVCPNHRPQMSTVRPGVMAKPEKVEGKKGELIDVSPKFKKGEIRQEVLEVVKKVGEMASSPAAAASAVPRASIPSAPWPTSWAAASAPPAPAWTPAGSTTASRWARPAPPSSPTSTWPAASPAPSSTWPACRPLRPSWRSTRMRTPPSLKLPISASWATSSR